MPPGPTIAPDAILLIKNFVVHFRIHDLCFSTVEGYDPWHHPGLDSEYEASLAAYLRCRIWNSNLMDIDDTDVCLSYRMILVELHQLVMDIVNIGVMNCPDENTIERLVDKYPTQILARVCKTYVGYAHMMGESVRRFIETTDFEVVPNAVFMAMEGRYPLTGGAKSPLTALELDALQVYLKTRKQRHIHLLLHCVYEFGRDMLIIHSNHLIFEDDLLNFAATAWFPIHLFAASRHIEIWLSENNSVDDVHV
jgi:hypothetical protein